ncbi:hypothetical protein KC19_8G071700 [Ceratodon purpureus]|uniref:Uncharacterized protein n=1 Tax=Ceratodon purpureus TaxID=3225 RepID=A0A8T0GYM8_CERPU|nr:hypothetical protein KC19_8G071700 [Ceratodon purpureus]
MSTISQQNIDGIFIPEFSRGGFENFNEGFKVWDSKVPVSIETVETQSTKCCASIAHGLRIRAHENDGDEEEQSYRFGTEVSDDGQVLPHPGLRRRRLPEVSQASPTPPWSSASALPRPLPGDATWRFYLQERPGR